MSASDTRWETNVQHSLMSEGGIAAFAIQLQGIFTVHNVRDHEQSLQAAFHQMKKLSGRRRGEAKFVSAEVSTDGLRVINCSSLTAELEVPMRGIHQVVTDRQGKYLGMVVALSENWSSDDAATSTAHSNGSRRVSCSHDAYSRITRECLEQEVCLIFKTCKHSPQEIASAFAKAFELAYKREQQAKAISSHSGNEHHLLSRLSTISLTSRDADRNSTTVDAASQTASHHQDIFAVADQMKQRLLAIAKLLSAEQLEDFLKQNQIRSLDEIRDFHAATPVLRTRTNDRQLLPHPSD